jgi:DNA repair protein RadC
VEKGGLAGIDRLSMSQLMQMGWIGQARAATIKAAFELGRRSPLAEDDPRLQVRSSRDVASIFAARLRGLDQEQLHVALVDTKNHVKKTCKIHGSSVSASIVRASEIF